MWKDLFRDFERLPLSVTQGQVVPWIHFMLQVVKKNQCFWECFQAPASMMQNKEGRKIK